MIGSVEQRAHGGAVARDEGLHLGRAGGRDAAAPGVARLDDAVGSRRVARRRGPSYEARMPPRARRPPRLVLDRSLRAFAYRCWPDGCPRERTCCAQLVPEVSRRERRVIDGLMPELSRIVRRLRDGDGYANVFVDDPPGCVIDTGARGCPFLHRTGARALCGIHSLALRSGRAVAAVKPASCRHWPLAVAPGPRGAVRVYVEPAAARIGCVAPRAALPGHPSVLEAFAAEIDELRGEV